MAKNKVQFKKGISLVDFMEFYGTEEQCEEDLYNSRWPTGFVCPECGHEKYCKIKRGGLFQCNACRHQSSLRSGSIFHHSKLSLRKWFLAIYLMTQSKNGISQLELHRNIGVSVKTAALLYHKISQTMLEREEAQPLFGNIEIDDAYWGGEKSGKRGRGSENKVPFVATIEKIEEKPHRIKLNVINGFTKSDIEKWSRQNLMEGSEVVSDGLACFQAIKKGNTTHKSVVVGNSKDSKKTAFLNWVNTILGNLKTSLKGTFHKLSPQYLNRHLATFVYRFNRRYKLEDMIPRFVYVALRTPPFPRKFVKMAESCR
jgi:transposase-like protein